MEKTKYNTNGVVEAGFMAVFITVILIVATYVPLLSFLGTLVLPIPIVVLFLRQDLKTTVACIIVSTIVTSMAFDPIMSIKASINYSLIGLTLGYCIKSKKTSYFTIMALTLACITSNILTIVFLSIFIEKTNLLNTIKESMNIIVSSFNSSIEDVKNMYKSMGMSNEQLKAMDDMLAMINVETLLIFIPACIIGYSLLSAYINYFVSREILKKLRYDIVPMAPFSEFYVTNLVGAFLIALICIGIILSGKNVAWGAYLSKSLSAVMGIILQLNGIAATAYFLRRKKLLSIRSTFFIILFSFLLGLTNVYFIIGFSEMILDFRRLDPYRIRKV
jgi:uncharacterized protein YybS (DUF2232 family)